VLEEVIARLGCDRESRRHRKADARHLRKPCALSAEQITHVTRAVRLARSEKINVFHFLTSRNNLDSKIWASQQPKLISCGG
jgi:hypothetical protein